MRTSVENETHDVESDTDVVLRLYGEQLDVDACLAWLPAGKVAQVWRKGEIRRGKPSDSSGCNVVLAEGMTRESVVQDAARAFSELAEPISELVRSGAEALVDFGLYVEIGGEPFPLSLPPEVMALFARAAVTIEMQAHTKPLVPTGRPTSWPVISEVIRRLRGARRERLH